MLKRLIILLLVSTTTISAQTAEIKGVVNFYFNEYQGNKIDIGAEVYLIDASTFSEESYLSIYNYKQALSIVGVINSTEGLIDLYKQKLAKYRNKKKYALEIEELNQEINHYEKSKADYLIMLKKYNAETNEKLQNLGKMAMQASVEATMFKDVKRQKRVVGGTGEYSFITKLNTYYIYIKSANRTSSNYLETLGKVYIDKVELNEENQIVDKSITFEL